MLVLAKETLLGGYMETSEIIFLVIAIAFVALVGFLIFLIVKANQTLVKVNGILESVQKNLTQDPKNLIQNANELSTNIVFKMKCLDPLFNALANIGQGLEFKTNNFKENMLLKSLKERIEDNHEKDKTGISDAVDCAVLGLNLWKKYKGQN